MSKVFTRRKFFRWSCQALTAGSIASSGSPLLARRHRKTVEGENYYQKLGVRTFINAAGTYTILSASTMPDEVQAAIAMAAKYPVHLVELQQAAGEYLARRLQCEAALVTAGAASALTLGTAACLTLGNKAAVHNLPADLTDLKNEVIVQKTHRYDYDHALRNCCIKFVEVETLAEYEGAFNERTVMAHFFNAAERGQISREDWVRVAHAHGVPCFNDAAADVPPISNLWNYTKMGFDLVTFSGGKGIRGPQNAGLLLGRKDLIAAAAANNQPISDTIGRGMKVAKEQIIGMVAAVDWFLKQDDAEMEAEFQRRANLIAERLRGIPTLQTQVVVPPVANHVPHLVVRYDPDRVKISPLDIAEKLRRGTPSIELNPATGGTHAGPGSLFGAGTVVVGVWMLQPGEDVVVAQRLREVLVEATQA